MPSNLPVPAVDGGAIETLINNLILQNEKTPLFRFTIFSAFNLKSYEESKKYCYTDFKYFRVNKKIDNFYYVFYRLVKKIFKIAIPDRIVRWKMVSAINVDEYDWILFEAGEIFVLKAYMRNLSPEKMLVHAHYMISPISEVDKYFRCYLPISNAVRKCWENGSSRAHETYKIWMNCIFTDKFSKIISENEKNILQKHLGIQKNDFVVIFVGRIIPEKGVLELLNSLQFIKNKYTKILIIGSANFAQKKLTRYEMQVKSLTKKYRDRVVFTGYVPNTEVYKYLNISEVSVVPSICEEAAGLVVLEAMAAGKPIITTGAGGVKEYIDDSCALFVNRGTKLSYEIGIAIDLLASSLELRNRMSKAAFNKVQDYDMSRYLRNLQQIISDINIGG